MQKKLSFFTPLNPLFAPIAPVLKEWAGNEGQSNLRVFNHLAAQKAIHTYSGKKLVFTPQLQKSPHFEYQYEPSIYLRGEVLTRENHWHDFFNALVWLTFPLTKAILNFYQYQALYSRVGISKKRSLLENRLTQFDENGAIVLSSNPELTDLLKNFQWKELFFHRREEVLRDMVFIIFGHSLYEKGLKPYVGMTASSLIFDIHADFLCQDMLMKTKWIDGLLKDFFAEERILKQRFSPLPLLGIPGWCEDNKHGSYYNNKMYFRLKSLSKEMSD